MHRQIARLLTFAAATAAFSPSAHAQAAKPLDDPTIVAIFDAANTWDIQTGQLAAKRGSTKTIRDFGRMLARDHTGIRQQGRDLAQKLNVTPTPPKDFDMADDHADAMRTLTSAKHGVAFDRAFLEHEVAYHKAVVDAVTRTLLPALKNEEVKALVNRVAPAFVAHQQAAERLLEGMGK